MLGAGHVARSLVNPDRNAGVHDFEADGPEYGDDGGDDEYGDGEASDPGPFVGAMVSLGCVMV